MPAVERHLHAVPECTRDALHPCACQDRAGRHLGTAPRGLPTTHFLQRPARPRSDEACRLAFQGHRSRQESGLRPTAPRRLTCWLLHLGRKRQQGLDSTPPEAQVAGPLAADITPPPCRERLAPACRWPTECERRALPWATQLLGGREDRVQVRTALALRGPGGQFCHVYHEMTTCGSSPEGRPKRVPVSPRP
jgi:hypothetical protein